MRTLFIIMLWFPPVVALGHPVDDPCPPGKVTEDGCQPVVAALGLDNPEFFAAHKRYWHCRRALVVEDIQPYAVCVGAVRELERRLYGREISTGDPGILEYWNRIPAHPELDFPGAVWRAEEQLLACEANSDIIQYHVYLCNFYRQQLRSALGW